MKKPASKADRAARISRAADRAAEVIDAAKQVGPVPVAPAQPAPAPPQVSPQGFFAYELGNGSDKVAEAVQRIQFRFAKGQSVDPELDLLDGALVRLADVARNLRAHDRELRFRSAQNQVLPVGTAPAPTTPEAANAALPVGSGAAPAKGH